MAATSQDNIESFQKRSYMIFRLFYMLNRALSDKPMTGLNVADHEFSTG